MATEPLRVVLYAGPGTGKSTTAALVFGRLKQRGWNVELAHEYAKELTWEGNPRLKHQASIAAEQQWRMDRLTDVDAIVTDTSTLYGLVYGNPMVPWWSAFAEFLLDEYLAHNTLNFFLHRDPARGYNPKGRSQSEEEAVALDSRIRDMLTTHDIPCEDIQIDQQDDMHVIEIVRAVEGVLRARNAA